MYLPIFVNANAATGLFGVLPAYRVDNQKSETVQSIGEVLFTM